MFNFASSFNHIFRCFNISNLSMSACRILHFYLRYHSLFIGIPYTYIYDMFYVRFPENPVINCVYFCYHSFCINYSSSEKQATGGGRSFSLWNRFPPPNWLPLSTGPGAPGGDGPPIAQRAYPTLGTKTTTRHCIYFPLRKSTNRNFSLSNCEKVKVDF